MRDALLALFLLTAFPVILYRYHVGALVIGFMSFMYPQSNAYGFALTIPWLDYFFVCTVGSYIIAQGYKEYKHHHLIGFLFIFYIWICLTSIAAYDPSLAFNSWLKFTKILALAILSFTMLNTEKRLTAFIKVMVISIGFYGMKGGIFTILSGGTSQVLGPINSFYTENNEMAIILVMTFPYMLYFIAHAPNIYEKYFSIACAFLTAVAVLGTQSRTGFIALCITFLYYTWLQKKLFRAVLILFPVAFIAAYVMADTWSNKMATSTNLDSDESFQSRVEMWVSAVKVGNEYPVMGGGFGIVDTPDYARRFMEQGQFSRAYHSSYFQMIGQHGYFGFLLFLFMIYLIFSASRKLDRDSRKVPSLHHYSDLSIAIRSSMVGYVITSLTANIAFFDALYFQIIIICIGAVVLEQAKSNQKSEHEYA